MNRYLPTGALCALVAACGEFHPDPVGPGPGQPGGNDWLLPFRLGAADHQEGRAVATAPDGGVFMVSWFTGTVDFDPSDESHSRTSWGGQDIAVARYDEVGNFRWVTEIGGAPAEVAHAAAATPDGGVVVVGHSGGTGTRCGGITLTGHGERDILIARLGADGTCLWAHQIGSAGGDEGRGVAVVPDGSVVVAGHFSGTVDFDPGPGTGLLVSRGGTDGFVARYSADGAFVDAAQMGGTSDDLFASVAVADDGGMVVGGEFRGTVTAGSSLAPVVLVSGGGTDGILARYTPFLGLVWAGRVGGESEDRVTVVAVGSGGRLLAAGTFEATVDLDPGPGAVGVVSRGGNDLFVAGYAMADGSFVGPGIAIGASGSEGVHALVADPEGFVMGGWFQETVDFDPGAGTGFAVARGSAGAGDAFIAAYGNDGTFRWVTPIGGVTTGSDQISMVSGLSLGVGGIWATGRFFGVADFDPGQESVSLTSAGGSDGWLARYSRPGGALVVTRPTGQE